MSQCLAFRMYKGDKILLNKGYENTLTKENEKLKQFMMVTALRCFGFESSVRCQITSVKSSHDTLSRSPTGCDDVCLCLSLVLFVFVFVCLTTSMKNSQGTIRVAKSQIVYTDQIVQTKFYLEKSVQILTNFTFPFR